MALRLGIGSYTFPWAIGIEGFPVANPLQPEDLVMTAATFGVSVVQICDNMPLAPLPPSRLRSLAATARDLHVRLEVGTRGIDPTSLARYLEICELLGSGVLRTLITAEDLCRTRDDIILVLREVATELSRRKIVLAVENYEAYSVDWLAGLIREVDSPYVRVCLDPVNSFGIAEDPSRVTALLGGLTANLHVKDFRVRRQPHRLGYLIEGTPAGEGALDIAALLDALPKEQEISGIVELWTPYEESVKKTIHTERMWARKSIEQMRRIVGHVA